MEHRRAAEAGNRARCSWAIVRVVVRDCRVQKTPKPTTNRLRTLVASAVCFAYVAAQVDSARLSTVSSAVLRADARDRPPRRAGKTARSDTARVCHRIGASAD